MSKQTIKLKVTSSTRAWYWNDNLTIRICARELHHIFSFPSDTEVIYLTFYSSPAKNSIIPDVNYPDQHLYIFDNWYFLVSGVYEKLVSILEDFPYVTLEYEYDDPKYVIPFG